MSNSRRASAVVTVVGVFVFVYQAARSAPAEKRPVKPKLPDPVEQNGPIFKGWPKPKLALVFTGEQLGYIEPCGCAGLENQKGGLRRRATFLKQRRKEGWPVVAFDNGGLISRFGPQQEIKYRNTVDGLNKMGYKAVAFGTDDLKLPAGALLSAVANADIFVSANAGLFDINAGDVPRYRVIEAGGMKIGVTAVFGDRFQKQVQNEEIDFLPAKQALDEVVPKLKKAKCDVYVLLAHATMDETIALAKQFPIFNIAVMAHGAYEPPHEPEKIEGSKTMLIEVGHKGMYAIVVGYFDDQRTPMRYQRVPLDHRFIDDPGMDELMADYQTELQQLGWEGLGLRPAPHPDGKFVGSKACATCHEKEYAIWKDTPHSHATDTLLHVKPPRQFDPECISCHATGWEPQKFFPYESGYDSLESTPGLAGSGCENCHGPGSAHVKAEKGSDKSLQKRLREALQATATSKEAQRDSCQRCHDIDNSPKFDFDSYWEKIAH